MIKRLRVVPYVLIVAYLLIVWLCPLGAAEMHMDIQYIRAPDNGFYGDAYISLDFDVSMKIALTVIAVIEALLLHNPTEKKAKWSNILCWVRSIPEILYGALALLVVMLKTDEIIVNITVFGYLLLLLCVASLVAHKLRRKQLALSASAEL